MIRKSQILLKRVNGGNGEVEKVIKRNKWH